MLLTTSYRLIKGLYEDLHANYNYNIDLVFIILMTSSIN